MSEKMRGKRKAYRRRERDRRRAGNIGLAYIKGPWITLQDYADAGLLPWQQKKVSDDR